MKSGSIIRVTIGGKRWPIHFLPPHKMPKGADGEPDLGTCFNPNQKGKKILINNSLKGRELVAVVVHELMHALQWDMSEEWVHNTSEDVAHVLDKLGLLNVEA